MRRRLLLGLGLGITLAMVAILGVNRVGGAGTHRMALARPRPAVAARPTDLFPATVHLLPPRGRPLVSRAEALALARQYVSLPATAALSDLSEGSVTAGGTPVLCWIILFPLARPGDGAGGMHAATRTPAPWFARNFAIAINAESGSFVTAFFIR
jgi:hypothetical protein